jgi:glycosyltransferase involved in cell wall biosynthesis
LSKKRRLYLNILNWATERFFPVSDGVKDQYILLFGEHIKIETHHMGVDVNTFSKLQSRTKYRLPENNILIMSVVFNSPIKGIDILLNAISLIKRNNKINNVTLCIVGFDPSYNPDYTYRLNKIIDENNISENIIWFGINDNVPEILAAGDIFIQPSRSEAISMSIMEAGMAGLPAIGSNTGGIPEVILNGKTGFVFNANDHTDLAKYTMLLIDNELLRNQMGEKARLHILKNFNIKEQSEKMAEKYLNYIY